MARGTGVARVVEDLGRDLRQGPGGPDITGAGVGRHTQDIETSVPANPTLLAVKDPLAFTTPASSHSPCYS